MYPYYLTYMAPQPMFVWYPSVPPSPAWSFSSQGSLPTPILHPGTHSPSSNSDDLDKRARSPPPKPKSHAPVAETPALRYPPRVNPLIVHAHPAADPSRLNWDLYHHPDTLHLTDERHIPSIPLSWDDLATIPAVCAAFRDGGYPLHSLTLVFRFLPLQIEVKPGAHPPPKGTPPEDHDHVSVADLFVGLYNGLRAHVDPRLFARMSGPQQTTLWHTGARRVKALVEDQQGPLPYPLRQIDFLRRRRRFLGIRVAEKEELPAGKRYGEVFVVEVGASG
ncbi:hypothetical protein TRAPUB_1135 [Trametes pubescens]|uniref:DUF6699 domain-containing protein n=1 Tax=Trametes pubescens TaxID=154538 RepID=A0A1M2VK57_TRAPU|nr:hypothetical protein TRAPUB_1135 [Trametes pubescens]